MCNMFVVFARWRHRSAAAIRLPLVTRAKSAIYDHLAVFRVWNEETNFASDICDSSER